MTQKEISFYRNKIHRLTTLKVSTSMMVSWGRQQLGTHRSCVQQ